MIIKKLDKVSIASLAAQWKISIEDLLGYFQAANMRVTSPEQDISLGQRSKIEIFLKEKKLLPADAELPEETPDEKLILPQTNEEIPNAIGKKTLTISGSHMEKEPVKVLKLQRKTKTTLVTGDQQRTINVEIRKKRTYLNRQLLEQTREEENRLAQEVLQTGKEPASEFITSEKKEENLAEVREMERGQEGKKEEVVSGTKTPSSSSGSLEETLGIDRRIVMANLEREKKLKELYLQEQQREKERLKAKKKAKVRTLEKLTDQKKIDVRDLSLLTEEERDIALLELEQEKETALPSSVIEKKKVVPIARQLFEKPQKSIVREVLIPETISVGELAQRMAVTASEVIQLLMKLGTIATINQSIDSAIAALVVEEMGHKVKLVKENALEETLLAAFNTGGTLEPRAPVVTIMGHVDHGKTKLLDCIRRTKVAEGEAGGITQHIGAYHVKTNKGIITFLDTPGHEAFTAMRARGVKITDIVVLVVAADDGVMQQTVEAIQHAKAAEVPILVAINKIDKPTADPERVKTELSKYDVAPEEWGGQSLFVKISAKEAIGIDDLLDAILLQAEMLELKAVKTGLARGVVVESRMEKGRGNIATILVQQGVLHKGDVVLAGPYYGHVRAMLNEKGQKVNEVEPSIPVEILGLSGSPMAGDEFIVVESERKDKEVALYRQSKLREVQFAEAGTVKLDKLFDDVAAGQRKFLNVILKTDVQGSLEALKDSLLKLSTSDVQVKIIASGVGGITESDVNLAIASQAVILGFNVRSNLQAKQLSATAGVDVRYYSIIYDMIEEVKKALQGLLAPEIKENILGLAEVREVFHISKFGTVAGCMVVDGVIKRNKPIHILRDHVVIYEGELSSLKHFKNDASEVSQNMECGIGIKNYNDIKVGDQIEAFERFEVERVL
jgi:translation initiation factor IF-2